MSDAPPGAPDGAAGGAAPGAPLLEMRGIRKRFGAVEALKGVDFELARGEVHALVGENGAGKSTLMKILSGVQPPSEGQLLLEGRARAFHSVADAQAHGVAMVYQELALVPQLSVAENLFLGRLPPLVRHDELRRRAAPLLAEVELRVDPGVRVGELGVGEQQLVEIAKAVSREGRILVLDEPTAALSAGETRQLFRIVRKLRAGGVSLVYISHRLEEIFELADRVTVLRDGERVATHRLAEVTPERVVREMVGREVKRYRRRSTTGETPLADFEFGREAPGSALAAHRLQLRRGEIVGLAGVVGSGRSLVLATLFGAVPAAGHGSRGGGARLDGEPLRSPRGAIARGLALVPGDRKTQGLVLERSVRENLTLAILPRLQRAGFLKLAAERREARRWVERLELRPPDPERPVRLFSGGNQQKVVVGRTLATEPRILLLEEPTRGVDVGARTEIYEVIDELAADGLGLLVSSSDTEELIGLCDRILVFRSGRVAAELHPPFHSEEVVAHVTGARHLA